MKSINYENYLDNRIINIFLLEEKNNLVILSINGTLLEKQISENQDLSENEYPLYKFNLNIRN